MIERNQVKINFTRLTGQQDQSILLLIFKHYEDLSLLLLAGSYWIN